MSRTLWLGLLATLGLALAVRLPGMLLEAPNGRDQAEYLDLADNLAAGRSYLLDIKAYFATGPPVEHYGMEERPPLLPALMAGMMRIMPRDAAARLAGPLAYLAGLGLIWDMLRRRAGGRAATTTGLLLAVQPMLAKVSLEPLTEPAGLACTGLFLWGYFGIESAAATGIGCALAFLARPSLATMAAMLGGAYLARAARKKTRNAQRDLIVFGMTASLGPLLLAAINLRHGAPALMLPQSFLFLLMDYRQAMDPAARFYPSAWATIAAEPAAVAGLIARHALDYGRELASVNRLGLLAALAPAALAGLWREPRLRGLLLLPLMGGADLALYAATWSTYDGYRFPTQFCFLWTIAIVIGGYAILDRAEPSTRVGLWRSLATWMFLTVGVLWLLLAVEGDLAVVRDWRAGRPLRHQDAIWLAPGMTEAAAQLNRLAVDLREANVEPVVAANEPWLFHERTGLPTLLLPSDQKGGALTGVLNGYGVQLAALHAGMIRPDGSIESITELARSLEAAGWVKVWGGGEASVWRRGEAGKAGKAENALPERTPEFR